MADEIHIHHEHESESDPVEDAAERIADEVEAAIEDATEAAEHSPEGAADIPHELHQELLHLHSRADGHEGLITQLRADVNELGRRIDEGITLPHEVEKESESDLNDVGGAALELPEEIIEPRKVHPMRRKGWPRFL